VLAGGLYERASGAAGRPLAGYRRRTPERTVLHELVAQHAQTMLGELRDADPEGGSARPAFAQERLAWTDDGRISYRLKRPWPDGRTELVLPPVAFLRRLCGIIPPPRRHLVRYSGVFGPPRSALEVTRARARARRRRTASLHRGKHRLPRSGRIPWADLLRRVFADDVLRCPCGGRR
jgi:hypothetical protein